MPTHRATLRGAAPRDGPVIPGRADPPPPLDPMRARSGARFATGLMIAAPGLFLAGIALNMGRAGWGTGLAQQWGWDVPPIGPFSLALLIFAPLVILRNLPRRPERSFLCGARDVLDRSQPVNRPRRLIGQALADRLRKGAWWCGAASAIVLTMTLVCAALLMRTPAGAGEPLPRVTLGQIARVSDRLPRYALVVDAHADREHVWIRPWRNRGASYRDVTVQLTPSGRGENGGAAAIIATVTVPDSPGVTGLPPELLARPLEGELSRAPLPAAWRAAMAAAGIVIEAEPVTLTPMPLAGKIPGADREDAYAILTFGLVLAAVPAVLTLILIAKRRRLLRG